MKFALFFMAEYANIVVGAGLITALFFGGWQIPWLPTETLIAHAQTAVLVALGALALLSILLLFPCRRWGGTLKRLYTDARRREADFWTVVLVLGAVVSLALAGYFWTHPLGTDGAAVATAVLQFAVFWGKVTFFGFSFIWLRWTLPRFRYDQLMGLGWKGMLPLALLNLFVTGLVILAVSK
jgi:NADH-quinone oxidoreductase subunit H